MKVNDVFDIFGGLLTVAVIAVILTKANTATDVTAAGATFTSALTAAEAG